MGEDYEEDYKEADYQEQRETAEDYPFDGGPEVKLVIWLRNVSIPVMVTLPRAIAVSQLEGLRGRWEAERLAENLSTISFEAADENGKLYPAVCFLVSEVIALAIQPVTP